MTISARSQSEVAGANRIARWLALQDLDALREQLNPRRWLGIVLVSAPLLVASSVTPTVGEFLRLRSPHALLALTACGISCAAAGWSLRRADPPGRATWALVALALVTMFAYVALLVPWSAPRAAAVMSLPLVLTVAMQGILLRSAFWPPVALLLPLPGVLAALLVAQASEQRAATYIAVLSGAFGGAVISALMARVRDAQREREDLRAAISAQMLDEEHRTVVQLTRRVDVLLGSYHDMSNTLMAAMMSAESLVTTLNRGKDPEPLELAVEVEQALREVRGMLNEIRDGRESDDEPQLRRADLRSVAAQVCTDVRVRFPGTKIEFDAAPSTPRRVSMRGGAASLRRVLENLVINACEGNGRERATLVRVALDRDPSTDLAVVRIDDNGPGFDDAILKRAIEGFSTTKPKGTGLGLYTSERLVLASGGTLRRSNRDGGGARVELTLSPRRDITKPPG